jgi:hypothetical protein
MMMNRRRFLRALGLTGAASVAGPSWLAPRAVADDHAPKRLIMLTTGHGTVYDGWKMRQGGEDESRRFEFDLTGLPEEAFSRALQPLHPFRERLLPLDGLAMVSAEKDIPGYRHEKGTIHAWTGGQVYFTGSDLYGTSPSIDQLVAAHVARPDRLPSLELGISSYRPVNHAGLAQQLPIEEDPSRVFERVFGLSTSNDPLLASRGSVLDFAHAEYQNLQHKLGATDRQKLQTHFDLVRQLERRIEGLASATCSESGDLQSLASTSAGYDALFRSMADVIATSFACDMTRVASLSLGDLPSEDFGWGGYLSGDAHFDFAHRIFEDEQAALAMTDYTRQHAVQLAYLVGLLASIPDSDGGSLMDNTLIVWASELGDGWHGYDRHCCLTVGGSWYFRPGRYLHYPEDTPISIASGRGPKARAGKPHQHLLVSVARAMGLDTDHVGDREVVNKKGERISLLGELEGMA